MRNASEAPPQRPEQRMSDGDITTVLNNATKETHLRIWYWPLSEVDADGEYEDDGYLCRNYEEMLGCEVEAVKNGTHLDLVVTQVDADDEFLTATDSLTDAASNEELVFVMDNDDCIHHIEVIKVGLPPPETFQFGSYDDDFRADPGEDTIGLGSNELDQNEVIELRLAMGRWLQHRGVAV